MHSNQKVVAEKLLQVEAVKLRPDQPFTWASGWKSPIYCDNRKVLGFPYIREFVKSELCSVIFDQFPDADLLAGVATAGIAWGAMTRQIAPGQLLTDGIGSLATIPRIYQRIQSKNIAQAVLL